MVQNIHCRHARPLMHHLAMLSIHNFSHLRSLGSISLCLERLSIEVLHLALLSVLFSH